ncbi:MAG: phosphate starvation-inducible protein PhoH [Bacteroidetes bacterium RIFCSPLOWO2_12_FULL_35_15]|nr:MAG: phosphate starvation-inducible protein PhoH [Bacteroidetes bacterium RIFCSPLOWO2_12_FULL_35_15]
MSEKKIILEDIAPIDLYGVNDSKLELIKKRFPNLKIVARGETIKAIGEEEEINQLEMVLNILTAYFNRYGNLTENAMEQILGGSVKRTGTADMADGDNVLVFGNSGLIIKARTVNQRKMVESIAKNDMVFAVGPAGTGKTYTAVALAVRALRNREVKKIILTRPAVEAGENLGFLPGDLKEKLDPYLQPLYDALGDMIPAEKLSYYLENRIIQIAPLAFMRGRTLDNAFVILDEAQNATEGQLKMFLTRMGSSAKFLITGDITQIDLPKHQPSGLPQAIKLLNKIEGIDFIMLDGSDIIRHKLVNKIVSVYDKLKS